MRRRVDDIAFVEAEDRVTLLDLRALDRPPLVLEGTAMDIWLRLDGSRAQSELVDELVAEYGAPRPEVSAGVTAFLAELDRLNLLERQDDDD